MTRNFQPGILLALGCIALVGCEADSAVEPVADVEGAAPVHGDPSVTPIDECKEYDAYGNCTDDSGSWDDSDYDGNDGGGGDGTGSTTTNLDYDGQQGCRYCSKVTQEMADRMEISLQEVALTQECQSLMDEALASIPEWAHDEMATPAGHDANYHDDKHTGRRHYYIDTTHGGFPWVENGWSLSKRRQQLAGSMIHEILHHRYNRPYSEEEPLVIERSEACVPGYDSGSTATRTRT